MCFQFRFGIIVFDIKSKNKYTDVKDSLKFAVTCLFIHLLGNKGENFSEEDLKKIEQNITKNCPSFSYYKVCARDNINISQVFENIAEESTKEYKEDKPNKCCSCSIN